MRLQHVGVILISVMLLFSHVVDVFSLSFKPSKQVGGANTEKTQDLQPFKDTATSNRRRLLATITSAVIESFSKPLLSSADPSTVSTSSLTLPLEFVPALGGYVVHYYLFGERFGAIIDTGSPFLTVPSTCNKRAYKYIWGCYHPELTQDSGYANTIEAFNSNQGTVVWRKAPFSFTKDTDDTDTDLVVFGVCGPSLLDGPGGVFFGLIRDTARWIRPSFLGQTNYQSFCVDLRDGNNTCLVLSEEPLTATADEDYIPLSTDLYKKYKAPVLHYTAKADSFVINNLPLRLEDRLPTYVIFDTGVTGMVVSEELFDGRYLQARKNKEKSLWGHVIVAFLTRSGKQVRLSATKPVTTPLGKDNPFRRFKGNLIVLGLAFLDGQAMTIDIPQRKLKFD